MPAPLPTWPDLFARVVAVSRELRDSTDAMTDHVLTEHQRVGASDCSCGAQLRLGSSYASHQRVVLRAAGVLRG